MLLSFFFFLWIFYSFSYTQLNYPVKAYSLYCKHRGSYIQCLWMSQSVINSQFNVWQIHSVDHFFQNIWNRLKLGKSFCFHIAWLLKKRRWTIKWCHDCHSSLSGLMRNQACTAFSMVIWEAGLPLSQRNNSHRKFIFPKLSDTLATWRKYFDRFVHWHDLISITHFLVSFINKWLKAFVIWR